jgi:CheY-like chemotaxis protein
MAQRSNKIPRQGGSPRQPKIICINDDLGMLSLISLIFQKMGRRYEVITASSPAEGLELIASIMPDLILLDIMMPELDGFEVLERVKSDPKWRDIPVIMVNPDRDGYYRNRALKAGAVDFLSLPCTPRDLLEVVDKALGTIKPSD